MAKLSRPLSECKAAYEVVVIGSGYGGSIAASRLARAGKSVCLLERGREFQPGDYPDNLGEAGPEVQIHSPDGQVGSRCGLYEFHVNPDMQVFKGCGLGGTSLVNANVSLKAEPWVIQDPAWPREYRTDPAVLDEGYERARRMLRPVTYPADAPALAKHQAHRDSGRRWPGAFQPTPINVTFKDGLSPAGVPQKACNGCGDCVTGCNVGAKNTLIMNYLPDARNHGAEIFTQADVRWVSPAPDGGWIVHFHPLRTGRERFDAPPLAVRAGVVVLAAGALGSTEILLRSQARGLEVSPRLGARFSGNGDLLAFGYNNDREINAVGFGSAPPAGRKPVGPCITGVIDLRSGAGEAGMVLEEGSLPGALAPILPAALAAAAAAGGTDTDAGLSDSAEEAARRLQSQFRGAHHGAVRNTQVYLVMSHDDSGGRLRLDQDRLRVDWPGAGNLPVYQEARRNLIEATRPLGGTFANNPIWNEWLGSGRRVVTVHPLGGCCMSDAADLGVVNHKCQVFRGPTGASVLDGLYVMDGSVVPRALGVNPLLTISAIVERASALLAQDRGWTINFASAGHVPPPAPSAAAGVQFTETMRGAVSLDARTDYARGEATGSPCEFTLTVQVGDVDHMVADDAHAGSLVGTVSIPALSAKPLAAMAGTFRLFVEDAAHPGTRRMEYGLDLLAEDGTRYRFEGFKVAHNDRAGLDLWADTTTLFVTLGAGHGAQAPAIGRGILRIKMPDFIRQLATMRGTGGRDAADRLRAVSVFGGFFAGTLWDTFGPLGGRAASAATSLNRLSSDTSTPLVRKKRELRAPAPQVHEFTAPDGTPLRLTRYQAGAKGPVVLVHGLGVSSQIFSLDTLGTNLVEHLCADGFDVWNFDFRASILMPGAKTRFTGDDIATQDHPAAVRYILDQTGAQSLQAVVHCFGSSTWLMAMLAGMPGVRSLVCSQIAVDCLGTPMTRLKTGLHFPEVLADLGVNSLSAYAGAHSDWRERLLNTALRLYPIPFREWCDRDVCRRIAFMYAPLYKHANLNEATHDAMGEMFGEANIEALEHLSLIGRQKRLVGADGSDRYSHHLDCLKLPILFLHGEDNLCFTPASTKKTHDDLVALHGPALYRREVIPGYGHIDCIFGREAARDVFPHITRHLNRTL